MRVLLYAKMLKETKTEEVIAFFVTFLSLVAFQLGGGLPSPTGYAYGWQQSVRFNATGFEPHTSCFRLEGVPF